MQRVAALYLPQWPIERLPQVEPTRAPPEPQRAIDMQAITDEVTAERANECSVPNTPGWRPGARWARSDARAEQAAAIDRLPAHHRPPMRELGRRSEPADHPFRSLRPDEAKGHVPFSLKARQVKEEEASARPRTPRVARKASPAPARIPRVTSERQGNSLMIAAACPVAQSLGVRPGMALITAQASVPGLDIHSADRNGDAAALRSLAVALARRFSPSVAVEGDDTLFIDLSGVAHLFGGEEAMAARLIRLLARIGHEARIAVADTPGAAWALAHFAPASASAALPRRRESRVTSGDSHGSVLSPAREQAFNRTNFPTPRPHHAGLRSARSPHPEPVLECDRPQDRSIILCPTGAHREAIATLPVAALRADPKAIELLRRLGIERVGALADMPRGPLARRFAGVLRRIDQARGMLPEPLDPVAPPEIIACRQGFLEPVATAEGIAHWLGVLVPRVTTALAQSGLGARRIELIAERVDHVPQRLTIGLARPTRDTGHILRLIVRRIEEVEPGYGIDAMTLHVRRADPLDAQPMHERLDPDAAPDLAELVDAIVNRIGARRLWRTRAIESDVPERSVAPAPPLALAVADSGTLAVNDVRRLDTTGRVHPWNPLWPRPARLLHRPERLDHVVAELPDRPPLRFTWRGTTHRVIRADGPERVHGEWWRRTSETHAIRDYFRVEDESGRRYWLYRRGDGARIVTGDLSWWLHGMFG